MMAIISIIITLPLQKRDVTTPKKTTQKRNYCEEPFVQSKVPCTVEFLMQKNPKFSKEGRTVMNHRKRSFSSMVGFLALLTALTSTPIQARRRTHTVYETPEYEATHKIPSTKPEEKPPTPSKKPITPKEKPDAPEAPLFRLSKKSPATPPITFVLDESEIYDVQTATDRLNRLTEQYLSDANKEAYFKETVDNAYHALKDRHDIKGDAFEREGGYFYGTHRFKKRAMKVPLKTFVDRVYAITTEVNRGAIVPAGFESPKEMYKLVTSFLEDAAYRLASTYGQEKDTKEKIRNVKKFK